MQKTKDNAETKILSWKKWQNNVCNKRCKNIQNKSKKTHKCPKSPKHFFKPCKTKQLTHMVSAASETVYISIVRGLMVQRGVVSYIRDSW